MILTFIDGQNFAMTMKLKCINHVSNRCGGVVSPGGGGTSMFSVPGMCRWTGYSFHHSCSRAGYRFLQKCSQKGILFSNFCSQAGLQCIFLILCSQTGCGFLQFCSQTGVFKLRKMLPDRVKITAPQRHTPVLMRTKCPPPGSFPPKAKSQIGAA